MLRALVVTMLAAAMLTGCQSNPANPQHGPDAATPQGDPARVYIELASSYLEHGQIQAAAINARKAVSVDPSNVEALILLSVAYGRQGFVKESEETLQKARSLSPDDPYVANALGTLYCGQQRYAEAHRQFDVAAASARNSAPWVAVANSGLCYREQGRNSDAIDKLQQALQLNPRFASALLWLARLNYDAGTPSQARQYINRYFEVSSPDAEGLWTAYQIETALGNGQRAESYATMLRTRYPNASQTYRLLGL